ncbi:MAG: hypothetical protein H0X16_01255 [Chloroflexi bacterium]|nr:hypothetical protein [Chloroflexota bacterium]
MTACATAPPAPTPAASSAAATGSLARASEESGTTPGGSASAQSSATPISLGGCTVEAVELVSAAVDQVPSYRYDASGFTYADVFSPDPNEPPATERQETAFDGAYQAPDRSLRRVSEGSAGPEPEETIAIGQDLWIRGPQGWQELPDAAQPRLANALGALLEDVAGDWQVGPETDLQASQAVEDACILQASSPTPGEGGVREVTLVVDPATALPQAVRVELRNVKDPLGNLHDSKIDYLFDYAEPVTIEPPSP